MNPCVKCAGVTGSCCRNRQIVLTKFDVERIKKTTGKSDFYRYEIPEPDYADQDDDPVWNVITANEDGTRRVMNKKADGGCYFLTGRGCLMQLESRPLICRLYPYEYNETSLSRIDFDCPISVLPDPNVVLREMDMPAEKAEQWRRLLYHELVIEHAEKAGLSKDSVSPKPFGSPSIL